MLTHLIQRVYCHDLVSVVNISYFNLLLLKHLVNCKQTLREWMIYEGSSKLVSHFVQIGWKSSYGKMVKNAFFRHIFVFWPLLFLKPEGKCVKFQHLFIGYFTLYILIFYRIFEHSDVNIQVVSSHSSLVLLVYSCLKYYTCVIPFNVIDLAEKCIQNYAFFIPPATKL